MEKKNEVVSKIENNKRNELTDVDKSNMHWERAFNTMTGVSGLTWMGAFVFGTMFMAWCFLKLAGVI